MARPKLPNPTRARIVLDSRDASRDKFVNLRLAQELFARGELDQIDMGDAYPNSYTPRSTRQNFAR